MASFKNYVSLRNGVCAFALAALVAGGIGAASLVSADAQPATQNAQQTAPASPNEFRHEAHRLDPTQRVEGRIAYVKAVLKITDAQQAQFDKLADAMRANAKDRVAIFQQLRTNRDQPKNAVERLEIREHLTEMRAQSEQRSLAALKPLYDSLTPDQKQAADALMAPHWDHHRA
jgi:hypothetical protein